MLFPTYSVSLPGHVVQRHSAAGDRGADLQSVSRQSFGARTFHPLRLQFAELHFAGRPIRGCRNARHPLYRSDGYVDDFILIIMSAL